MLYERYLFYILLIMKWHILPKHQQEEVEKAFLKHMNTFVLSRIITVVEAMSFYSFPNIPKTNKR